MSNEMMFLKITLRSSSVTEALSQLWFLVATSFQLIFKGFAEIEVPVSAEQAESLVAGFKAASGK